MNFNELTPAETERLVLVIEECAEVQQIISKILRHGYESYHPKDSSKSNRQLLEKELGDLQHVIHRLMADVDENEVRHYETEKASKILPYLHHQGVS